ncbi:baseplate J/gp47 family protein [Providencia hangzhouensis]|uniref:baseplate J/gp47 family protein n=1 Tax=Providencia hangzhouensis TaxID=3031799 RepID=UPI0034DDA142
MNQKPNPDYEKVLADNGMPTTETQVNREFTALVKAEGLITNTSTMSPFWRLISAIVTAPVMWLKDILVNTVIANMFLATAGKPFIDLFAWAVNVERKAPTAVSGLVRFTKHDISRVVTVPRGTIIQTERINGVIHQLSTTADFIIPAGALSALVPVNALSEGAASNLAPGYFRILPVAIDGIDHAVNEENWIVSPGANEESDDELRDRVKNQFNVTGHYHIDAVYRGAVSSITGITTDRIYFEHDAPRGPGTANVFLLLDAGVSSTPFIQTINDYLMAQGYHGHGDDILALPLPETTYDLSATVYLVSTAQLHDEAKTQLLQDISHLIRCAFRENSDYTVLKTWPYSRFAMSRLGEEIHQTFNVVESVIFSRGDILSDLEVPRLGELKVSYGE